jgi:hypothetical protein
LGVNGNSQAGTGVQGAAEDGIGVTGKSSLRTGVFGVGALGVHGEGLTFLGEGVRGVGMNVGVRGESPQGTAVRAISSSGLLFEGLVDVAAPVFKVDTAGRVDTVGEIFCSKLHQTSDADSKVDCQPVEGVIPRLLTLRTVSFCLSDEAGHSSNSPVSRQIGVLAQEVDAVFPELVSKHGLTPRLAVHYAGLTAVLIQGLKELHAENDKLMKRIEALEMASAPTC